MVKIETAISLVVVVMDALDYRKTCVGAAQKDLPDELLTAALKQIEADGEDTTEAREWLSTYGVHVPTSAPARYRRRTNNQKSAEVEGFIRELLDRGWAKTAIAKQLKVNRRVVIRVAREAESAQNTKKHQKQSPK